MDGKAPPPARSKIPTKNFYNFRYKFKPESVDDSKNGVLEPKAGSESGFRLEHPSTQQDEKLVFNATEQKHSAQNWECVVVYDEETGVYTLEVLDSSLDIQYDSRMTTKASSGTNGDAIDTVDDEPESQNIYEEEEEEILEHTGTVQEIVEPPQPPPQPKPKKSKKPPAEAKPPKAQPPPKSPTKGKGKSTSPIKLALPSSRPRPSTPRKASPEPPAATASAVVEPPPLTLKYDGSEGGSVFHSDEDDMEPVTAFDDQGQDADDDALARELDLNLMDDDEEGSTEYRVEDHPKPNAFVPLSLNRYAEGLYDDESSSSDDSEG